MHEKESNRPTISRKEDATFFREMKGSRIILAQIDHVFFAGFHWVLARKGKPCDERGSIFCGMEKNKLWLSIFGCRNRLRMVVLYRLGTCRRRIK